ncbi:MAG: cysteine--tRNA ligase [Paracoccaceae bacterium]
MVTIRLTNTMTRKKEDFVPLDPANVRMYVCGPTVYDRAHLGNARPVIVFDVLYRLLRHAAKENGWGKVTYVRNFTDVDDKINAEAQRRKAAGRTESLEALIRERTEETIAWYHADMDALGALRPDFEPRATEYIGAMIAMTEGLIASGHAYAVEGHVLFRVRSYGAYGALSGRSVDDMIAGARVEVAPFKEDPMDFVLWKPSDSGLPGWDSPWGKGRPGWHIECSAMSLELLGETFDIHGGGLDLQFPHHENEIAQSACAHPHGAFARYWLHNEMLQVEGRKMSKSLGNFFTVRDLLEQGIPGSEVRMALLLSHYRDAMDYDVARRKEAQVICNEFASLLGAAGTEALDRLEGYDARRLTIAPLPEVIDALSDDLDARTAIQALRKGVLFKKYPTAELLERFTSIFASQIILGFDFRGSSLARDAAIQADIDRGVYLQSNRQETAIERAIALIAASRERKDFDRADQLRAAVLSAGANVSIAKDGIRIVPTSRFDLAKLEALK